MNTLTIPNNLSQLSYEIGDNQIIWSAFTLPPEFSSSLSVVGIDPGQRNMGLAFLMNGIASLYQIQVGGDSDSISRILNVMDVVNRVVSARTDRQGIDLAGIEGPAPNMPFGQVPLAEARTAGIVSLMQNRAKRIELLAPPSWRKLVFGNGRLRAEEQWPMLKPDAASALGIAWATLRLVEEEKRQAAQRNDS